MSMTMLMSKITTRVYRYCITRFHLSYPLPWKSDQNTSETTPFRFKSGWSWFSYGFFGKMGKCKFFNFIL